MSELIKKETFDIKPIDDDVYSALKNSVYPGAKDNSIAMVLSYCNARKLDPLQKPVHIVPMYIKDNQTGQGAMRDIIMPGIGLYRIQAQRSGAYAGQSDPEFGEEITEKLGGVEVSYPKWCKITVRKLLDGQIVEFSAKEFWKENYATAGKDTLAPNAMWKKRSYGQLSKCTEAQALRKAFPDILDQTPTAEEMEGKHYDDFHEAKRHQVDELNKRLGLIPAQQEESEAKTFDQETGEVIPPEVVQPETNKAPFTLSELENKLKFSKTVQELIEVLDVINSTPDVDMRVKKELMAIYRQRQKELV